MEDNDHTFTFDYVFKTDSTQQEVFDRTAAPLLAGSIFSLTHCTYITCGIFAARCDEWHQWNISNFWRGIFRKDLHASRMTLLFHCSFHFFFSNSSGS
jgi:hypothetical protein